MTKIQYLGQNGFKICLQDMVLYFDPYLSDCVYKLTGSGERNYDPPILAENITDGNYYFISHEHLDHLDPWTVEKAAVASPKMQFVCPHPHIHILTELGVEEGRIISAKAFEKIILKAGTGVVEVIPIPEKHEEYNLIEGCHGNLGYLVRSQDLQFYHAGDAVADQELLEDLKAYGRMNVMFLPINGHDWKRRSADIMGNMNYREALDLCHGVGTDLVVPMHYDLFDNNTENPAYFVDYLYKNYRDQRFKMFMPGESIWI